MDSTTPLQQRWARFAQEDLVDFAGCSALFGAYQLAQEFRATAAEKLRPRAARLALAARRTAPKMPLLLASTAVGLAAMKVSIAAVAHYRQDFSRDNVLMAFPLCGVLLNAHRGPRAIVKGALGLAALGYGADIVIGLYHRQQFELAEREEEAQLLLLERRSADGLVSESYGESYGSYDSFTSSSREY